MKSNILSAYPNSTFAQSKALRIFIADFSERTGKKRGVEMHENMPPEAPDDSEQTMDCFVLNNSKPLEVCFNIFDDHQFKDAEGKDIEHCECCFFPTTNDEKSWVGFIEIKDCKPRNLSEHKQKTKEQIISTVRMFRQKDIINKQKVYGIISFPRKKKVAFDQTIFGDYCEYKQLYQAEKIRFLATNSVTIVDEYTLKTSD